MARRSIDVRAQELTTYGRSHAVRLSDFDYVGDSDIHLTICAQTGAPFRDDALAALVCENVEFYCRRLGY